MKTLFRLSASATALIVAGMLATGCATAEPPVEPEPTPDGTTPTEPVDELDFDAAWLDEGRMVALVTQGSSTCVPEVDEASADGQTVHITLTEGDPEQACTADLTDRATLVTLPAGVDPANDVELVVTMGSVAGDSDLDGNGALTGTPGDPTEYLPTAGWYDDASLVLLTWGSSTCLPVVDSVEADGNTGTVNFVTEERPCTMDMVARATLIHFDSIADDVDDDFTLTLAGDNLDATVPVREG